MNISKIIVEIIAVDLSGREKELAADPKKKKSTNMIFWTIKKTK